MQTHDEPMTEGLQLKSYKTPYTIISNVISCSLFQTMYSRANYNKWVLGRLSKKKTSFNE